MANEDVKLIDNQTKGKVLKVQCVTCTGATEHQVMTSFGRAGSEYIPEAGCSFDWTDRYEIIKCGGCQSVSFRNVSWCSENDPYEGEAEELFPKRGADTIAAKSFENVPRGLRRIYSESVDCFNNDSRTLCAAGLRALVEGICAEQGVTDGPVEVPAKGGGLQIVRKSELNGRINGMQEKGLLTQDGVAVLHAHRFLGNDAVHQLARPTAAELKPAIQIIEHVLEHIYEMPAVAEDLHRATAARKRKPVKV